jgi:integrase/recombinase XerD
MLSPQLLEVLRAWWRQCRSQGWLFPGRDPFLPITTRQFNRACHVAAEVAGLGTWVTPHTLRHSFATHLLESIPTCASSLGRKDTDPSRFATRACQDQEFSPVGPQAAMSRLASRTWHQVRFCAFHFHSQ